MYWSSQTGSDSPLLHLHLVIMMLPSIKSPFLMIMKEDVAFPLCLPQKRSTFRLCCVKRENLQLRWGQRAERGIIEIIWFRAPSCSVFKFQNLSLELTSKRSVRAAEETRNKPPEKITRCAFSFVPPEQQKTAMHANVCTCRRQARLYI